MNNIETCNYQNMSPPDEGATGVDSGRRDRAYSEGHALIFSKTNSSQDTHGLKIAADTISHANATSSHKMTCSKKHHAQHHHHGNRPRSKSLDLHRHRIHSTPVHKKKYPNQYKHIPLAQSPGGHHRGRISPSSPKVLEGKMWVRPAAVRSPMLTFPALSSVAPTPSAKEHYQQQVEDAGFTNMTSLNDTSSAARQVTNVSSSPNLPSFDDEIMLPYASPSSSLFDPPVLRQHSGPARIIFGESGKPIKPRTAFEQYAPAATVL